LLLLYERLKGAQSLNLAPGAETLCAIALAWI